MEHSKEGILIYLSSKNLNQLYIFHDDLIYHKILWISELNLLISSYEKSLYYQRSLIIAKQIFIFINF